MRIKLPFLLVLFSSLVFANAEIKINHLKFNEFKKVSEIEVLFSGDRFQIELSGLLKKNTYVLLRDSRGKVIVLGNVSAASHFVLPGSGKSYRLDNNPGLETIITLNTDQIFSEEVLVDLVTTGEINELGGEHIVKKRVLRHIDNKNISDGFSKVRLPHLVIGNKTQLPDIFFGDYELSAQTSGMEKNLAKNLLLNNNKGDLPKTRGAKDVKIYKDIAPSVVYIENYTEGKELNGSGSGSIINKEQVLTNWHVIKEAHTVMVGLKPERGASISKDKIYRAEVIKVDEKRDLALLKLNREVNSRKPIKLGNSDMLEVGEDVHAIGHPGSGALWTYTKGYISQFQSPKQWSYSESEHEVDTMIQTQTPINPGNSGGPLLNGSGELVGVNTSKSKEAESINFSVSVNDVKEFIKNPEKHIATTKKLKSKIGALKKVFEATGINVLDVVEFDYDEDGQVDVVIYLDQDKNEKAEEIYVYLKKDEKNQLVKYSDPDEDGKWNEMAIDFDMNAKVDVYFFDEDGDQEADIVGYDYDEDGVIDEYKEA